MPAAGESVVVGGVFVMFGQQRLDLICRFAILGVVNTKGNDDL